SNEPFLPGIHHGAETLQATGTQRGQVTGLCEDHFIDRLEAGGPHDRIAGTSCNGLSVRHDKPNILLDHTDPSLLQKLSRDPGKLGTGIDQQAGNAHLPCRLPNVQDLAVDLKRAHVGYLPPTRDRTGWLTHCESR